MTEAWWNEGGKLCMWWDMTNFHLDPTLHTMHWDVMGPYHRWDFIMSVMVSKMIMCGDYTMETLTKHLLYYEEAHKDTGGHITPWLRHREDGIRAFLKVFGGLNGGQDKPTIISPVKRREEDTYPSSPTIDNERRAQEIPPQEAHPSQEEKMMVHL